ncbi:hypothetical protein pb186bvf_003195 [Paramecium bursaria]
MNNKLLENIQMMLKYQYFADISRFKSKPIRTFEEIADEQVTLGFPDVQVWFSNKDCGDHLDIIVLIYQDFKKKIWDSTPKQLQQRSSLDAFLRKYSEEICDKFKKYQVLLEKVAQIQVLKERTYEYMNERSEKSYELLNPEQKLNRTTINFRVSNVEEFNIINYQNDSRPCSYYLTISYQDVSHRMKGTVETFAMNLNFEQEFDMELDYDIGTLQINLVKIEDEEEIVIASRNLDPFTNTSSDISDFPLRIKSSNNYLNLKMKLSTKENLRTFLESRIEHLEYQFSKQYKQCHLYKVKLRLMLQPFETIKFDDNGIYLQKLSSTKRVSGCTPCIIF